MVNPQIIIKNMNYDLHYLLPKQNERRQKHGCVGLQFIQIIIFRGLDNFTFRRTVRNLMNLGGKIFFVLF